MTAEGRGDRPGGGAERAEKTRTKLVDGPQVADELAAVAQDAEQPLWRVRGEEGGRRGRGEVEGEGMVDAVLCALGIFIAHTKCMHRYPQMVRAEFRRCPTFSRGARREEEVVVKRGGWRERMMCVIQRSVQKQRTAILSDTPCRTMQ